MSRTITFCLILLLINIFVAIPIAHAQTMTFTPSNRTTYNDWEPKYNDTISFTVTVSGLNAAGISKGEVRFDFEKVSKWKGICMNYGSGTKADLFFRYSDQTVYTAPRWKKWSKDKVDAVAEWQSSDRGYCGTPDIESLRRDVQFVRMSSSGYRESHPHDIDITEEAPNYTVANLNT